MITTLALFSLKLIHQDVGTIKGHTRDVTSLAVSADGRWLASGSTDLTVRIWDAKSKASITTLEGHDGEIGALAFSPDGKYLASGEMYKKVKIWDTSTWKEIAMFTDCEGALTSLVFSKDSSKLFGTSKDNSARRWKVGASEPGTVLKHNYSVVDSALSPDGTIFATFDDGGNLHLWDANTLKQKQEFESSSTGKSIAFSPDGKIIATGSSDKIRLWDLISGEMKVEAAIEANSLAFSPDGKTLMAAGQDNFVYYLNAQDLGVKAKFEKHERPVTSICFMPDGSRAFSGSMDMTIRIWKGQ